MRVHTSAVIIDRLIRLAAPLSPAYRAEHAGVVLEHLNTAISVDSKRRYPVFDMDAHGAQCEVSGLTGAMLNAGFTLSFWLNVDTAQLLQKTDVFSIIWLISADDRVSFRVFANNGNIFIAYTNGATTVHGQFWGTVAPDEWIPFTVAVSSPPGDETTVAFYCDRDSAPLTRFPRIRFPAGNVRLVIGGGDGNHADGARSPGRIGPFAVHCNQALAPQVNYAFDSDPNFEHFRDATFTSDAIAHPPAGSPFRIVLCRARPERGFLETITTDYDLNSLAYALRAFGAGQCPAGFLQMFLGFIATSTSIKRRFCAVPCLATLLPVIATITYHLYSMFFTFVSNCSDQWLIVTLLDHIVLNINIWMRADFPSVARIIHHWTSTIVPTFHGAYLHQWSISVKAELRLLNSVTEKSREIMRQIHRETVCQRDSAIFARDVIYERDSTRCFAQCPLKTRPKFDARRRRWHPWELLGGTAVQTINCRPGKMTSSLGETIACRWQRASGDIDVQISFSPLEASRRKRAGTCSS